MIGDYMKKILIFYASYGGGHLSAAKSIKQYIDDNYSDVQTDMIDCVKYINNALYRFLFNKTIDYFN